MKTITYSKNPDGTVKRTETVNIDTDQIVPAAKKLLIDEEIAKLQTQIAELQAEKIAIDGAKHA